MTIKYMCLWALRISPSNKNIVKEDSNMASHYENVPGSCYSCGAAYPFNQTVYVQTSRWAELSSI